MKRMSTGVNVVSLRRLDTHEPQRPLEDQLDKLVRLPHHVSVALALQHDVEGPPADARADQVVAGELVGRHRLTTSPGFQSGLRSQYS